MAFCTAIALGACATSRGGERAPHVFSLETAPPKTVPAGCPVTLSFLAESQADLVQAKVTWKVRRVMPGGRILRDHWYAILPIAEHVAAPKTRGFIALQLNPRLEGTYEYAVEVEDTNGGKSNVLYKTVLVDVRLKDVPCPPADPTVPRGVLPTRDEARRGLSLGASTPAWEPAVARALFGGL